MEIVRISTLQGGTPAGHRGVIARLVEESPGRLRVQSCEMEPRGGAEPHVHSDDDQMFLVLEGELVVCDERGEPIVMHEGEALRVPAGAAHATRNDADGPVRYIVLTYPTAGTGEESRSVAESE